jgi:glycerol-3-phosphate dehydrogenase (NAD(P)+)
MRFGIIGAGSWGVALAQAMANAGNDVLVYSRQRMVADEVNNHSYHKFPGISLSNNIKATSIFEDLANSDVLFIVTPAQTVRAILTKIANQSFTQPIVLCSKGIEQNSLLLLNELVEKMLPRSNYAVLSGPNFAREVAEGLPAITSIASKDTKLLQKLADNIHSKNFRIHSCKDVISVEVAGAAKNILAIACGIAHGLELGENARAAIITRGLNEIARLCVAKGGEEKTLMEPAGIGDISLTCNSTTSRNMEFGYKFAQGETITDLLSQKTVEGVHTTKSVYELAKKLNVSMPICTAVYKAIYDGLQLNKLVSELY